MRAQAGDVGLRHKVIQIYLSNAVDRIDERNCVSSSLSRGARGIDDVCNVWSQFDDHWDCRGFHYPTDDLFGNFRALSDGRTHSALAHPMRATKIQLDAV